MVVLPGFTCCDCQQLVIYATGFTGVGVRRSLQCVSHPTATFDGSVEGRAVFPVPRTTSGEFQADTDADGNLNEIVCGAVFEWQSDVSTGQPPRGGFQAYPGYSVLTSRTVVTVVATYIFPRCGNGDAKLNVRAVERVNGSFIAAHTLRYTKAVAAATLATPITFTADDLDSSSGDYASAGDGEWTITPMSQFIQAKGPFLRDYLYPSSGATGGWYDRESGVTVQYLEDPVDGYGSPPDFSGPAFSRRAAPCAKDTGTCSQNFVYGGGTISRPTVTAEQDSEGTWVAAISTADNCSPNPLP